MESDAERVLSNLYVIGALSHNDKLMTNDDSFDIYTPTTLRAILRTWYRERRGQNIDRVRRTVRHAMQFARAYMDDVIRIWRDGNDDARLRFDTFVVYHVRVCEALRNAMVGLSNLRQTYRDDAALTSQLSGIEQEVNDFLRVIEPYAQDVRLRSGVRDDVELISTHPRPLPPPSPP